MATILKGVTPQSGEGCGTCSSRVKSGNCIFYATHAFIYFLYISYLRLVLIFWVSTDASSA
jgi:hypothetical protein